MIELDCGAQFNPLAEEEFFALLPAKPAVFRIEMRAEGAEPYLGRTADLRRRMERLLRRPQEPTKRLNLREIAAGVRYRLTGSKFEQALALYQQARRHFPKRVRDFLRLRPPALLKVNLANAYPRCYVTRRMLTDNAFYFGPFPSRRAADHFANEFLNLFKIRRCQIKIRRDPAFPGCMYSEMKMCLAPCFAGCTKEEYAGEVTRVVDFLATAGAAHTSELARERDLASEGQDFERAAAIHKKVEKVTHILRGLPDLPRRIEDLTAVVLQRTAEEGTVAAYALRAGMIHDPFFLRFGAMASEPRSVEALLRENLQPQLDAEERVSKDEIPGSITPSPPREGGATAFPRGLNNDERADHLSLLARWYYSKPREGEIFFREAIQGGTSRLDWPYRRILRACSRVLRGQQAELPLDTAQNQGSPIKADETA